MRSPPRPSQVVREVASVATPQGHHVVVTLERISTGGTWREAAFLRAAAGAMHEPECGGKKRAKALFHETLQPSLLRCLATLWPALEGLFASPCSPTDTFWCAGRLSMSYATASAPAACERAGDDAGNAAPRAARACAGRTGCGGEHVGLWTV